MQLKKMLLHATLITLVTLCAGQLQAQTRTISGTVVDDSTSDPLHGVTIQVKGGKQSAVTNMKGEFTMNIPTEGATLQYSYVNYEYGTIKVTASGTISIRMKRLDVKMDEVIVVGYATQKKAHLTGAIESIKGKDIEDLPMGNLGAGLAGRILGLSVSGGNARPGSQASLTVRNPMSLAKDGGNNNPLYVIDDVIQVTAQGLNDPTLFNSLDPSEVESISILKDAAAAVYGSRGANGVVIVRTKRGAAGKPRITYSGSYAWNDEAYRTKMMNAYEMARYINIANGPNGANITNPDQNDFFSQDELDYFKTIDHDWLDQAWQSAYNMRHTLNVSGGADKATYFASVSYFTQDGNLGPLDYNKWTYRAGADITVLSGLKAGLQVAGNDQKYKKVNNKVGGENEENDYRNLLKTPRYIPPYVNGLPVKLPGANNSLAAYHFFELNKLNNFIKEDQSTSTVNIYLEYDAPFLKGLKARASYARNKTSTRNNRIGTKFQLYTFTRKGENGHIYEGATDPVAATYSNDNMLRFINLRSQLTQANFNVTYTKQIGQHSISALFSVERSEQESQQDELFKADPSQLTNGQLSTAFGAFDGRQFLYEGANLGYIGRINYNYAGKYLAEFLFRTDASTKFSPENYWGKFYSVSGGWIVSQEKCFQSRIVDFLKVRYSLGLLGKDDTRAWQWRQRYTFNNGKGGVFGRDNSPASLGMKMEASPNPDATWSDDFKQNLGIDAKFLNSRLSTTIELFYNKSTNMLIERTGVVPVTVGGTLASQNWGAINFFGYELAVGWNSTVGRDFNYGVDLRFSWSDNKVKQGNFNEYDIQFPWNAQPGQSSDNGKWGLDYLGMFKNQGEIDAYVSKYGITSVYGTNAADLKPGMLYYRDVRGAMQADGKFAAPDGIIDDNDQIRLARKASAHYGISSTLRAAYKGLSLECVIGGSFGGWSEMDARDPLELDISGLYANGPAYWGDVYDPELNPNGKYPNPYWEDINTKPLSSFWKVNAFRLRIINATLSYGLPKKFTSLLRISSARFVVSALNPVNLYNPYSYKDANASWDNYPVLRTISFGANVTF